MPKGMQAIYTQVIGATPAGVTFNNIPQTFTDLKIVMSTRENTITGTSFVGNWIRFNGDSSASYSNTYIYGNGSGATSVRETNQTLVRVSTSPTSVPTANTFNNGEIYIPNYISNTWKAIQAETAAENNATFAEMFPISGLYRSFAPITSITILPQVAFTQGSTITLYGIAR